jgi:N-methylhydantoinase B
MKNAFTFVCDEMGTVLRRTSYSPNIKERMDASCAIFDAKGRMLAQAEHIPVHLGSMPLAVSYTNKCFQNDLNEGDQIIVNDPYQGGSHLNDITLVKPIFFDSELVGFAVNKAHHADVGGKAPGSMPSDSQRLGSLRDSNPKPEIPRKDLEISEPRLQRTIQVPGGFFSILISTV